MTQSPQTPDLTITPFKPNYGLMPDFVDRKVKGVDNYC